MANVVQSFGVDDTYGTQYIEDIRGAYHFVGAGVGYNTVKSGELAGSATALQMPNVVCKMVKFKARGDNVGNVYIGGAGVTTPDGTSDSTTGFELDAGQETGWLPVDNLNTFYRICDQAGDDLTYIAMA
jgi:hypothetical protein